MVFHKVIGIDLGTTYSAVSVWDYDRNQVVIIPSALGQNTIPSVVGLDPQGKVVVGSPAQNNLINDPQNTIIEAKRIMGEYERKPNPMNDDPGIPLTIPFLGRNRLPQEISAFILMELKRQAEAYIGDEIHDAVITVPAYFQETQRGATEDAARIARLNPRVLLNEPTAAATAFGATKLADDDEDPHIYAVYDLGGGTFDVSIIRVQRIDGVSNVTVVGTGGDPKLGGGDFDDRITGWALQQIHQQYGTDLSQDPNIWARIKREAEKTKRELSAANAAIINLPYLTATISANLTITRDIFNQIIDDLLKNSLTCLDNALDSAYETNGIERDDVEAILLVGGSTRIPQIRSLLAEYMDMDEADVRIDINPDEAVSIGAALIAKDQKPSQGYTGGDVELDVSDVGAGTVASIETTSNEPTVVLQDVTSHTLGILANQNDFVPIIEKERAIPAEEIASGFINGGPTTEIPVMIFQGEDSQALNNTMIGKLPIILPEPKPRGFYNFEVKFSLDKNGLLRVEVRETNMDKMWETNVQCNVRASKAELENKSEELYAAMSDGAAAPAATSMPTGGLPQPPGSIPKPPGGLPKPPMAAAPAAPTPEVVNQSVAPPESPAQAVQAAPTDSGDVPALPDNIPDDYRSEVRRAYKLINKLPAGRKRDSLIDVYKEFLEALEKGDEDELEEAADELYMIYKESR